MKIIEEFSDEPPLSFEGAHIIKYFTDCSDRKSTEPPLSQPRRPGEMKNAPNKPPQRVYEPESPDDAIARVTKAAKDKNDRRRRGGW